MKKTFYIIACTALTSVTFAQSLQSAKNKMESERYDEATIELNKLINAEPSNFENYFYLGENYLLSEKLDSAAYFWNKAGSIEDKSPLIYVARGKALWLQGKKPDADFQFEEALRISKRKNAEVYRQIGSFLTDAPQKDLDKAIAYLKEAVELDPNSVDGYLFLGDAILAKNPANGTDAIREYNNAERIQQSPRVIVRKAKLYQGGRNYKLADEMYVQAQTLDPKYAPAYKAHAELQGMFGKYDLAIKNWEKYLALNSDNYAKYKYAAALFNAQRFCDALKEVKDLAAQKYTSIYTERIEIYSTYECTAGSEDKNNSAAYENGSKLMDGFIAKYEPKKETAGMDYKYQALYFSKLGKNDEAIKAYYKAAEDTSIAKEVLSGLAKTFAKEEKFSDAIVAYNKIIAIDSNALSLADYFDLARVYFMAKDYVNSDRANARVLALSPTYSFSYFWRARANVFMDLDKTEKTWKAKQYYDGYLANTTPEQQVQYKSMTLEAYKYLGDYYINSPEKNTDKAKEVWTKVIELDPANEAAYKKIVEKL